MTRTKEILAAAIIVFAGANAAAADDVDQSERAAKMLAKADADGDGAVSRDELTAWREQIFARIDRNNDGALNDGDRRGRGARRIGERIDELEPVFDIDGDGSISRTEFVGGPTQFFDFADADGDDVVTADELKTARAEAASHSGSDRS